MCLWQVTIPCKKQAFRLYGREGVALVDLLLGETEPYPKVSLTLQASNLERISLYNQ